MSNKDNIAACHKRIQMLAQEKAILDMQLAEEFRLLFSLEAIENKEQN